MVRHTAKDRLGMTDAPEFVCVKMERLATTDVVRGQYINCKATKVINTCIFTLSFISPKNFYELKCNKFGFFIHNSKN